ncbi:Phospholipase/carboxylesterase/thioesterase [Phycomyces blakesleeanus]
MTEATIHLPTQNHTATVIWLHGAGDCGESWLLLSNELSAKFPHVKWIFPNAPLRPLTCYDGAEMPAWFDIVSFVSEKAHAETDTASMKASVARVNTLIENEIKSGIPVQRIILGGFSQGCVISLLTTILTTHDLGGTIGCSGFIPSQKHVSVLGQPIKKDTPLLVLHGDKDIVVPVQYGRIAVHQLEKMGYNIAFYEYPGLAHSFEEEQLVQVAKFLKEHIPTLSAKL